VDESEWLRCTNPGQMLGFLRGKASDRKLGLFRVACCRRVWDLLTDERSRTAVEVVERFVDGQATEEELEAARKAAVEAIDFDFLKATGEGDDPTGTTSSLSWRTDQYAAKAAFDAIDFPKYPFFLAPTSAVAAKTKALGLDPQDGTNRALREVVIKEFSIQAHLLRDIFGNPFRPVTVDPSWLTWKDGTVLHLSRSIYEDRRFGDLPVLADALEEAGCSDPDILGHCRSGGDHVRGCWVVDRILGME
jgi:hypothetical protein